MQGHVNRCSILPLCLTVVLFAAAGTASAVIVTVNDAGDSTNPCTASGMGTCTLRDALNYANTHPGTTIFFDIPGSGVHTITPASDYPQIVAPVTIDGFTQPGSSANSNGPGQGDNSVHLIEINGTNGSGPCLAFSVGSGPSAVSGLVINRCVGDGISFISTGGGNIVAGNFVGTNPTGTVGSPNPFGNGSGVKLDSASPVNPEQNDVIGGVAPADRNLLSAIYSAGIYINAGSGHLVQGNFIGTNAAGTAMLGNGSGIVLGDVCANTTIGGTTPAARNLVSGSYGQNVTLSGNIIGNPNVTGNVVEGNFIGTDVTGTKPLAFLATNAVGVYGLANTIGGSAAGAGNVIGGGVGGIEVGSADGSVIQGNFIGTDVTGTVNLGSHEPAIMIDSNDILVGGIAPGEGNVIAFNGVFYGLVIVTSAVLVSSGTGNAIRGNSIHDNATTGITFPGNFPLGNDLGDADTGPNNSQNFPVLASVTYGAGNTTVTGLLNSTANTTFGIDFFANPPCSRFPRDFLQGETYLGTAQVTTDGDGNAPFTVSTLPTVAAGSQISMTATDPNGNTSEFSQRLPFSVTVPSGPATGGTALTIVGTNFLPNATVTIGGVEATDVVVSSYNSISATSPALAPGANDIVVTNTDGTTGTLVKGFVADFLDVPSTQQFYLYVTTLVSDGIASGVGGGLFGVDDATLRQQMAVLILKAKHGLCYAPPACTGTFTDVPCPSLFADWIEAMAAEGITGGCGGTNFCPQNPVRRDQMAVFLLKAEHGSTYVPPMCSGFFTDVPCPSPFANWIEELYHESISRGCGGGNYCPGDANTRGQMAVFLVKTFQLP